MLCCDGRQGTKSKGPTFNASRFRAKPWTMSAPPTRVYFAAFFSHSFETIQSASTKARISPLEWLAPKFRRPETFFESEAQLRDATNAVYTILQSLPMYTRQYFFSNDLMAQECEGLGSLGGDLREYIDYTWTSSNANIKRLWDIQYQGIHKA